MVGIAVTAFSSTIPRLSTVKSPNVVTGCLRGAYNIRSSVGSNLEVTEIDTIARGPRLLHPGQKGRDKHLAIDDEVSDFCKFPRPHANCDFLGYYKGWAQSDIN